LGRTIVELFPQLVPDPWRSENPFSPEVQECQKTLFDPRRSRADKVKALSLWLHDHQPCLFARKAASDNSLSFCLLTEHDIAKGDDHLRDTIQLHRKVWKDEALSGQKHGFIILLVSEKLAYAEPNSVLKEIALRLCELYLSEAAMDDILLDQLRLRVTDPQTGSRSLLKWDVGVNWFGAQGDGRWWHDHRIPGGVGLSMNSVGHMARTMVEQAILKNRELAERAKALQAEKLVRWALPTAMRTILTASRGERPGTCLAPRGNAPLPSGVSEEDRANILGKALKDFNEDHYGGYYHTDYTLPSEYFDAQSSRPENWQPLAFTYLHRQTDADYISAGLGDQEDYLGMALEQAVLESLGLSDTLDS
jgi:hypothetical protein